MFESNIINIYGKKGKQWLDYLPNLITHVEATYGIKDFKSDNWMKYPVSVFSSWAQLNTGV